MPPDADQIETRLREALSRLGVRDAAAEIAAATGLPRREVYRQALALRDGLQQDDLPQEHDATEKDRGG